MSIKLKFDSAGWSSQAVLKDEALPELIELISKNRVDEPGVIASAVEPLAATQSGDRSAGVKEFLVKHSPSELLNMLKWDTNVDQILLLGAFHEASGKPEGWRSADMEARFSQAKEAFPANFARDISVAIKDGLIAPVTPRTYKVSRSGWNKISEAIAKLPPDWLS